MNQISNLAFVHPEAKIGDNVMIDPFVYIDRDVVVGNDCHIYPHVSIRNGARIGNGNKIHEGAIISASPQDFRWDGKDTLCIIGDNNTIREQVIINRSITKEGATRIGDNNYILAQSHVGHDSEISDKCVIGNGVKIAGSCHIGHCTVLSSGVIVHEKCDIGQWCMIKGGTRVNNNVPPYIIMAHNPISYFGVNSFIMGKNGFSEDDIDDVAKCYRHLYQANTSVFNALKRMQLDVQKSHVRDEIIKFIENHNLKLAAVKREFME